MSTEKGVTSAAMSRWKDTILREERARDHWHVKWGWILNQYKLLEDELASATNKQASVIAAREEGDKRDMKPFPETASGKIGWISTRKDFNLEIYGSYPYCAKIPVLPAKSTPSS